MGITTSSDSLSEEPNTTTDDKPDHRIRARWSDALLLAIVPFLGYAIAYSYEFGYMDYFRIPPTVIELSLQSIFWGCLSAAAILAVFAMIFNLFFSTLVSLYEDATWRMLTWSAQFAILVVAFFWGTWTIFFVLLATISYLAFFEFIYPLLSQKKVAGYQEKLRAQDEFEQSVNQYWFDLYLLNLCPPGIRHAVALFLVAFALSAVAGQGQAYRTTNFFVDEFNPDDVIVRVYATRTVGIRLENGEFRHRNFFVRKIPSKTTFVMKKLGRIEPPPLPSK